MAKGCGAELEASLAKVFLQEAYVCCKQKTLREPVSTAVLTPISFIFKTSLDVASNLVAMA